MTNRVKNNSCGLRIGTGVDVHRFAAESIRELWLAGLLWKESGNGLEGHSDADVAVHSMIDALLSAAQQGDIGTVFGTDDPGMLGASGITMLAKTVEKVRNCGFSIANVSVQIIANRPQFSARSHEARKLLSGIVGAPVSINATTSDGLGLTGRSEGIAAISNALIYSATEKDNILESNDNKVTGNNF